MKTAILPLVTITLFGCASQAVQQQDSIVSTIENEIAKQEFCSDPKYLQCNDFSPQQCKSTLTTATLTAYEQAPEKAGLKPGKDNIAYLVTHTANIGIYADISNRLSVISCMREQ